MAENSDAVSRLITFSKTLEEKLNYFIEFRLHLFLDIPKRSDFDYYIHLEMAWNKTRPRFIKLRNNLEEFNSIGKLNEVGLSGDELSLKLFVFTEALEELESAEEEYQKLLTIKGKEKGFKIWHLLNKLKNFWEKFFDHANTILSSLGIAGVPGADAIGEFKSVIEKLLRWQKRPKHKKIQFD